MAELTPTDWHWKLAEPGDTLPKGEWWTVFNDPVLNELESSAVADNQNLQASLARIEGARAAARISRSNFLPGAGLSPAGKRERTTGNLPTPIPFNVPSAHLSTFSVPFDLSYEVDLWGRVRRAFESSQAQAQATAADFENAQLTLNAEVAVNYFLIRSLEEEMRLVGQSIGLREESLRVLTGRHAAGVALELEVEQARTELASAKTELIDLSRQREAMLHALALLCGQPASNFTLAESVSPMSQVRVPVGLPAALLERRPDIAAAERSLASRNAQIGVARAAYFPSVRLTGQAGYLSADVQSLFSADSRVWSIGPSVSLPLFSGGRTAAEVRQAEAAYDEALANYRQVVLAAFKDVEDSLSEITYREQQIAGQAEAIGSAGKVVELSRARYQAGNGPYLSFVDAQRQVLANERVQVQLRGQRQVATVRLIKALGGGLDSANAGE